MSYFRNIILLLFLFSTVFLTAQNGDSLNVDTTSMEIQTLGKARRQKKEWTQPDPMKVVWMGAVIPGYGQILNRKYWKLPIVYGGFMGCAYAISWNSGRYESYKQAYLDITDTNESTNSFLEIIPEGYTLESYGGESAFSSLLKSGMDQSRYYRDLSVIISVAYYGLTLVDAFVDAQLADFDISPDLSMKIHPKFDLDRRFNLATPSQNTFGIACSFKF